MEQARITHRDEWEKQVSETLFPLIIQNVRPEFAGTIKTLELPRGLTVSEVYVDANHLKRTERLVRQDASEHVLVLVQSSGKAVMRQADREVLLANGAAALADPSSPYELKMSNGSHQLVLLLPSATVLAAGGDILEARTRLIPPESLALRSLAGLARELVATTDLGSEAEGAAAAAVDLLGAALTRFKTTSGLPVESSTHEAQRRLVQEFVYRNLGNPGLSVDFVARAHGISARHLATLFGPDSSPGAFIRRARLERIYADLTNPQLMSATAADIAARWGYLNYATLNRAFHREFGIAPQQVREYGKARTLGP
jgi:AraC-like DNA-binding protein